MSQTAWEHFADAVIHRAVRQRQAWLSLATSGYPRQDDTELQLSDQQLPDQHPPGQHLPDHHVPDHHIERLVLELPSWARHDHVAWTIGEIDTDLTAQREALHSLGTDDPFGRIASALDLDTDSIEVLALVAAVGWNLPRQRLIAYIQDEEQSRGVTISGLSVLLRGPWAPSDTEVMEALAPDGLLRRACLLDVHTEAMPGTAVVTVPTAVQWHLRGVEGDDPDLPGDARRFRGGPVENTSRLLLVHGPDRIQRLDAVGRHLGTSNVITSPEPANPDEWAALVRAAVCHQAAVVLEIRTVTPEVRRWLTRAAMVQWVISSPSPTPLDDLPPLLVNELEAPDRLADDQTVKAVLGEAAPTHRLTTDQLDLLARIEDIDSDQALRRLASGALEGLATRIRPERTWDDLVLPDHQMGQLREMVARVRHRDLVHGKWGFRPSASPGVVALFSGPSGTGKTMATEILAGELGLEIFRIDLSAMVSKYIGETEKNLERIFDAAEGSSAILLFDEADAIFGKRTAVTDAHDRYANVQTSYLLQRIEAHEGIVILTTNLPGNIDTAFTRRIHVAVEFPSPEPPERLTIWQRSFPPDAPVDDLNFDELAQRFPVTGGSIRAAALGAAFLAAEEGSTIAEEHILVALRREYDKLGRFASLDEFNPL